MAAKNLENVDLLMDAVQALVRSQNKFSHRYFTSNHILKILKVLEVLKILKVLEGRVFSEAVASAASGGNWPCHPLWC